MEDVSINTYCILNSCYHSNTVYELYSSYHGFVFFITTAMTETSLDIFHGSNSSTSSSVTSNVDKSITSHHIVTSLPFDFGRKPITDEEMEAINVR